jgi:arylsulfatase A-like enzyme
MKKTAFTLLALAFIFISHAQRNVILIIADDLGLDYCGFYENHGDTVNMPNIRRLLAKSVRFTNAMSNPYCSATRAGILTGRYGFRTGVGGIVGDIQPPLDTSEMSIPRLLNINAPNAVATALIGKWHLHLDTPATNLLIPNLMGFDYFSGNFKAGHNYFYWSKITNGVSQPITNYATTETTNDAINWINSQDSSKPFFCLHIMHLMNHIICLLQVYILIPP